MSVSLVFLPTTLFSSVSACRLGICKGQVNFLTQEHFARTAEYTIYTVDVPCALGSAYLLFLRLMMASVGQYYTGQRACFGPIHLLNPLKFATLTPRFQRIEIDACSIQAAATSVFTDLISRVGQSAARVTLQYETRTLGFARLQYNQRRSYND